MRYHTVMYSHVFVAGTFDQLHAGHHALLDAAIGAGEHVTIGLTSDAFVKKYKTASIQPFDLRKKNLEAWLEKTGFIEKCTVIPIDDPYEPAASDPKGEVLVVTEDNKARGEEINEKRKSRGLPPFAFLVLPLVPAEDTKPISSTRVRAGEITTTGKLIMPDALRPELGAPLGDLLTGDAIGTSIEKNRNGVIITVGDMTAKTLLTAGIVPNFIIVDFQVERKPYPDNDEKLKKLNLFTINVRSGPGFISNQAIETIQKWANHPAEKMILAITGEEDLLTLPVVAYGPAGAVVYYGQPNEGMVEVVISDEKKTKASEFLRRFDLMSLDNV